MPRPSCPICKEEYDGRTVRPHVIPECAHSMCEQCCKMSGRCGTCNGSYSKTGQFKVAHDLEIAHREGEAYRRLQRGEVNLTARQMEELFLQDDNARRPAPVGGVRTAGASEPAADDRFPVFVRNFAGKSIRVDVKGTDTVAILKQEIKVCNGTAVCDQLLHFSGQALHDDERTLASYNIGRGVTIQLLARQQGGLPFRTRA